MNSHGGFNQLNLIKKEKLISSNLMSINKSAYQLNESFHNFFICKQLSEIINKKKKTCLFIYLT